MKFILLLIWVVGCVKSDDNDASKHLHLNKTRFEEQIDMINGCMKKGGLSDHEIKKVNSKKLLESMQTENPQLVCANYTNATPEHPTVRRCRYLLHPITTIELCLEKSQKDNGIFRAEFVKHCNAIKLQLASLSAEKIQERNLESFPMYRWLNERECINKNYDPEHESAGSGGQ